MTYAYVPADRNDATVFVCARCGSRIIGQDEATARGLALAHLIDECLTGPGEDW